jgi:P27 family predicted phage terminase small subunit
MKRPTHLDSRARDKFEELGRIVGDKLKEGDENLLAVLANAYIDYKEARKVLTDRGPILAGDTMTRQNPAHNMMKDLSKMIESLSRHFGLSPWARGDDLDKVTKVDDALDEII